MIDFLKRNGTLLLGSVLAIGLVIFSLVHPPDMFTPPQVPPDNVDRVELAGFSGVIYIYFILNYAFITFFGYLLARHFLSDIQELWMTKFLGCFFIGYITSLSIARVVSLVKPYDYFYWPTVMVMGVCMLGLILVNRDPEGRKQPFSKFFLGDALSLVIFGGLLFLVLFLQMRQNIGAFMWVGHGPGQYAHMHDELMALRLDHFPLIKQHYDELMFHEFLYSGLMREFNPILPWWMTLGIMKVSVGFFMFLIFRKFQVARGLSIVFSSFLALGTFSLNPTKYYMFFDSGNPLWLAAHSGRMVGIVFAVLFLIDMVLNGKSKLPVMLFALAGAGLSATSVSNMLWIWIFYGWGVLCVMNHQPVEERNKSKTWLTTVLCFAAVGASLVLYGLPFATGGSLTYVVRVVGVILVLIIFLVYVFQKMRELIKSRTSLLEQRSFLVRWGCLILTGYTGLLFLGNILVSNPLTGKLLDSLQTNGIEIKRLDLYDNKGKTAHVGKGSWAIGDYREIGGYNAHCHSLKNFIIYYGGMLMMILMTQGLFKRLKEDRKLIPQDYLMYDFFILAVAVIPALLLFMDFVDYGDRAWVKSRFLEIPLYVMIVASFYFISRSVKWVARMTAVVLVCYAVIPFFASNRPSEIRENWRIFVDLGKR